MGCVRILSESDVRSLVTPREAQVVIGLVVLGLNAGIYSFVYINRRSHWR